MRWRMPVSFELNATEGLTVETRAETIGVAALSKNVPS
jgi:hypothetical protein